MADQLREIGAARCASCGLRPSDVGTRATGGAAHRPCPGDFDDQATTAPPIALDTAHIAAWLRGGSG